MNPTRKSLVSPVCCALCAAMPLVVNAQVGSTIDSNFNGTKINGGNFIWFHSHLTSVSYTGAAYPFRFTAVATRSTRKNQTAVCFEDRC